MADSNLSDPVELSSSPSVPMEHYSNYSHPSPETATCNSGSNSNPPDGAAVVAIEKFSPISTRMIFLRKIFCILMIQFAVGSAIIGLFLSHFDLDDEHSNVGVDIRSYWPYLTILTFLAVIILAIMAYFWEWPIRTSPRRIILMGILTLSYSVFGGLFSAYFGTPSLLYSTWTMALISLAFIIFSLHKRCDLTYWIGFFIFSIVLGITAGIFMGIRVYYPVLRLASFLWSFPVTIVVSVTLIYDVKRIMDRKHKFVISPEDVVFGALAVYLDIIMIPFFAFLVCICGKTANCSGLDGGFENAICAEAGKPEMSSKHFIAKDWETYRLQGSAA